MVADQVENVRRREVVPGELPESYYDFGSYVSRERMLTFWHQLDAVLACRPTSVLEVGVGARVVAGTLRERGVEVTTLDVNPSLKPTVVGRVQDLDKHFEASSFDVVLCARVLHHVPFAEFGQCMHQLASVSRRNVVLTLPVDDLRVYFAGRITSQAARWGSIRLPRGLKQALLRRRDLQDSYYARLWKIDSTRDTSLDEVHGILNRDYSILDSRPIAEDRSHHLFRLEKRRAAS